MAQCGRSFPCAVGVTTQNLLNGAGKALAGMVITETYPKAVSGGALDPKTFELPKATGETIVEP